MPRESLITYDGLRISSGGAHRLAVDTCASAWAQVVHFLKSCTDFDSPEQIILELLEHPSIPRNFLQSVRHRFGEGYTFARSRVVGNCMGHQWLIAPEQLNSTLEYVDSFELLPKLPLAGVSPLTIYPTMKFRFVDPASRELLPFQNPSDYLNQDAAYAGHKVYLGSSMASAGLSKRSTLSVFFSLPFLDVSAEFFRYAEFLTRHAPFKFSEKQWKIWKLNGTGSTYVPRKMDGTRAPRHGS